MFAPRESPEPAADHGAALVVAILMLFICTTLALALLQVTETELAVSHQFDDHNKALMVAEAGVQEALWRLRLRNDNLVEPVAGSRVVGLDVPDKVAGAPPRYHLRSEGAYINPDPFELTHVLVGIPALAKQKGDEDDNDSDGDVDEVDELDRWRDWRVRIIYGAYDEDAQVFDESPDETTLRGDDLVLPSVFTPEELLSSEGRNRGAGRFLYTTEDPDDEDVLSIEFLREDPYFRDFCAVNGCLDGDGAADIDGDGENELVYYDADLVGDGLNNAHSISAEDDEDDNESPYNIDRGGSRFATGYPVLVVRSTGRVMRRGRLRARRRIEARFTYDDRQVTSTALCTCEDMDIRGSMDLNSYDSNEPDCQLPSHPWNGTCPINTVLGADIGTNGSLHMGGSLLVRGSVTGGVSIDVTGRPDVEGGYARSRGSIDCGSIDFLSPPPGPSCQPADQDIADVCTCTDVAALVESRRTVNDNHLMQYWSGSDCSVAPETIADPSNIDMSSGFLYLPEGGNFYFENFDVTDDLRVLSGAVEWATCTVTTLPAAPIQLYVEDHIELDATHDYLVFENLRPADFTVLYWGDAAPMLFDFGARDYVLNLLAPYSEVDFQGGGYLAGSVTGKTSAGAKFNGSFHFYYDRNLDRSMKATVAPGIIDWRELL